MFKNSGILELLTDWPCGFNLKCAIDFRLVILSYKSQVMFYSIYKGFKLFERT